MGSAVRKQSKGEVLRISPPKSIVEVATAPQTATDCMNGEHPSYSLYSNTELESQRICLPSFKLLRTIGYNSWSRTLLARENGSQEVTVLKIYWKENVIRAGEVTHCISEKKALELVKSQWWQKMLGVGQDEKCLYFALEYVPGGDLFRIMHLWGKLTLRETEFYACELFLALSDIHSWRFCYRDLKPENVLLDANGHIKLSDMHLAKFIKRDSKTKTLCGTPEYMSPEMIDGSGHSLETDWWQLGIIIYELLSARTPFYDTSPYIMYTKILLEEVRFPGYFPHATCLLLSELLNKHQKVRIKEQQIKYQPFFENADWNKLSRQQVVPPFLNRTKGESDDSYYDHYHEFTPDLHESDFGVTFQAF